MKDRIPTTVNLTDTAQKIKDDLAPLYSLKNIISAGLLLFYKLSSDEREKAIREAQDSQDLTIEHKRK